MCTSALSEVKELTPEWYTLPDFLTNVNGFQFGSAQVSAVWPWQQGDEEGARRWVEMGVIEAVPSAPEYSRQMFKYVGFDRFIHMLRYFLKLCLYCMQGEVFRSPFFFSCTHRTGCCVSRPLGGGSADAWDRHPLRISPLRQRRSRSESLRDPCESRAASAADVAVTPRPLPPPPSPIGCRTRFRCRL